MILPLGFLGNFGSTEVIVILVVALLIFGNRLPGVAKSLGKSITQFKKGMSDITDQIKKEPKKTEEQEDKELKG